MARIDRIPSPDQPPPTQPVPSLSLPTPPPPLVIPPQDPTLGNRAIDPFMTGGGAPPPTPPSRGDQGAGGLPADLVGDIPPPPIPALPTAAGPSIIGPGVAGLRGTTAGTFARPGTRGAAPFRTTRFGPGIPGAGAGANLPAGLSDTGVGLTPEEAADILRRLAAGGS